MRCWTTSHSFAPFVQFFDLRMGRSSTPTETYLRMMFLKFRYRLA
jgi:IS5 family transposase